MAQRTRLRTPAFRVVKPAAPSKPLNTRGIYSPHLRYELEQASRDAGVQPAEYGAALAMSKGVPPSVEEVRRLQQMLRVRGHNIAVDGIWGPQTQKAWEAFQKSRNDRVALQQLHAAELIQREQQKYAKAAAEARRKLEEFRQQLQSQADAASRNAARDLQRLINTDGNLRVVAAWRRIEKARRQAEREARDAAKPKGWKKYAISAVRALNYLPSAGFSALKESTDWLNSTFSFGRMQGERASWSDFKRQLNERKGFGDYIDSGNIWVDRAVGGFGEIFADPTNLATAGLGKLAKVGDVAAARGLRAAAHAEGVSVRGLARLAERRAKDQALQLMAREGREGLERAALGLGVRNIKGLSIVELRQLVTEGFKQEALRAARQSGRAGLASSRVGQALIETATKIAAKPGVDTVDALRKRIKGLASVDARLIVDAAKTEGEEGVRRALEQALVRGTWNPSVKVRRQLGIALGGRLSERAVGNTLYRRGLTRLEDFARPDRGLAIRNSGKSAIEHALDMAGSKADGFIPDVRKKFVEPAIEGLSRSDRLARVMDFARTKAGNASLLDAFDAEFGKIGDVLRPTPGEVRKQGIGKTAFKNDIDNVTGAAAERVEQILQRMENLAAILDGAAGEEARERAQRELAQGFALSGERSGIGLVNEARKVVVPGESPRFKKLPYTPENYKALKARIEAVNDPDLRDRLLADLEGLKAEAKAKGPKKVGLGKPAAALDQLADPEILDQAKRLLGREAARIEGGQVRAAASGLGRRVLQTGARGVLAILEEAAPDSIPFMRGATDSFRLGERIKAFERWSNELGADEALKNAFTKRLAAAKTERQIYKAIEDYVVEVGRRLGLDDDAALAELRKFAKDGFDNARRERPVNAFSSKVEDGVAETVDEVQVVSQIIENIPLPDPSDFRQIVRELKAERGSKGAKVTAALGKHARDGVAKPILELLRKGHRAWKFQTVTGLYAMPVGFAGGFIGEDGDLGDKLWAGARWGLAGAVLPPVRYLQRVVGIEEKLRKYMAAGMLSPQWVPGLSRVLRRHGLELPFVGHELIRGGSLIRDDISKKFLTTTANHWEAILARNDSRFLDGWWRIINYQIHPESDVLTELFLRAKAGLITDEDALRQAKAFLRTEDGKVTWQRMRGARGAPKSHAEMLARYQEFIDQHVPSPELAQARLAAAEGVGEKITRDELKAALKAGVAPESIHVQRTWVIPRNYREVIQTRNQIIQKFIFEGPTTLTNREPLAEAIYRKEYLRLRSTGVSPEMAQEVASEIAVERTNRVMFNINDESRFAKKIDFVFPFQQPREELVRVWAKLAVENPGRTYRLYRAAAMAFNYGEEHGIVRKDPVSGQWVLTVPGSARLSRALGGLPIGLDANIKDFLFFGQGAYGLNIIPSPGGPWWTMATRELIDRNPAWYENMNSALKQVLFPYGNRGVLLRDDTNRLWMALVGGVPPWELTGRDSIEDQHRKVTTDILKEMMYRRFLETGRWEDIDPQELQQAVRDFYKTWFIFRSTFPAAPHPVMPTEAHFNAAKKAYTDPTTGKFLKDLFLEDHPQFAPFMRRTTEYVGPDDFDRWKNRDDLKLRGEQYMLKYRRHIGPEQFAEEFRTYLEQQKAYTEYERIWNTPGSRYQREQALADWREKYPELAEQAKTNYQRDKELWTILHTYPHGPQEEALDRWRKEYNVSYKTFLALKEKVADFRADPWKEARYPEEVYEDVQGAVRRGFDEATYVATLPPAEQANYWLWKMGSLSWSPKGDGFDMRNAKAVMAEYNRYKAYRNSVFKAYPFLSKPKRETPLQRLIKDWQGDYYDQTTKIWDEIGRINGAIEAAKQAKDWKSLRALYDKRSALFDAKRELDNKFYRSFPLIDSLEDEVRAVMVFRRGDKLSDLDFEFVPSEEERKYLAMPPGVQAAYIQQLTDRLNVEPGEFNTKEGDSRLYWRYLTDFQKDLLETHLPPDVIEGWKGRDPDAERKAGGRGGRTFGRLAIGEGGGEIAFAIEMFKQYNQRGDRKEPKAYKEYLALPNNPAVRSAFLKEHPEVAEWIKLGPMANMPEVLRFIVANIMVKYGRWQGELRTMQEITDLAFAREQLARWSRRGDRERPAAYDIWIQMPSGPEKAAFLKAHPEVQEWIRLGPMANMPDEYRDVVRDIMVRYGEWTEKVDPLSEVISAYYRTPGYARQKFLEEHPELVEYWAATRSPEEQAIYALADQYFAIQDPGARRAFLAAHPELQDHFLVSRQKRYERFLNRVAMFMGSNPELFQQYLERQTDILGELLQRFSEPPMLREVPRVRQVAPTGRNRSSEGGRQRRAS